MNENAELVLHKIDRAFAGVSLHRVNSVEATISTLSSDFEGRFSLLTRPQRAAVRAFLKFMAHNGGQYVNSSEAKQALRDVWVEH